MLDQLVSPPYAVFSVAFLLMLGIGAIEAIGLGLGNLDNHGGFDGPAGDEGGLLNWLGLRTGIPMLIWLTGFLACFTLAGLALQQAASGLVGTTLHWGIATPLAFVIGLCVNAFVAEGLARVMPEYESTAIDPHDLLRLRGTVVEGTARRGVPARAKVVDHHGQAHYVMIEPHDDEDAIALGDTALLVRKEGPLFFALNDAGDPFRSI